MASYFDTLTAAINDMIEHGFDSAERVAGWQRALRDAAERSLRSPADLSRVLQDALRATYTRLVERGGLVAAHPGVARFTLERLAPTLRGELDRRIMASADLIRLNREESIARQLRRFSGWATSIPAGGASPGVDRRKLKAEVRRPLASLPFEERRVMIDQGHKLVSAINTTVAEQGGAIAARWRAVHQAGYDHRPVHLEWDGSVRVVRGCWALEQRLIRPGPMGYTDEIEQPAELPFCRCSYVYLYTLSQLPPGLVTEKGLAKLSEARRLVAS